MKKINKNRKGFTLIEMMLSLAIICLIGGVIGGVCVSISNSFVTTYNIDDAADYAMLYARAFENSVLDSTRGKGATGDKWTWYIDNPKGMNGAPLLKVDAPKDFGGLQDVFTPKFIGNSNTPSKWSVIMFYGVTEKVTGEQKSILVDYRIYIKDNYSRTDFITTYDGKFWIPRFQERAKNAKVGDSRSIAVITDSGSKPMNEKTMKEFCTDSNNHFNSKAYNAIKDGLEDGSSTKPFKHYTKLRYTWG